MRKMSEVSNFTDDDEDGSNNFGGFTSTVCVNFSPDDLRLATIPGQVSNKAQQSSLDGSNSTERPRCLQNILGF